MTPAPKARRVPIDKLHEDPGNPRHHPKENVDLIKASLQEFGQDLPILVQKATGRVIAGNGRLRAMRDLGWKDAWVVEVEYDDLRATRRGIVDNRSTDTSHFDEGALAALLKELEATPEGLAATGYGQDDLQALLKRLDAAGPALLQEDQAVAPPADPVTRPGDLWRLPGPHEHLVLCADATEPQTYARLSKAGGGRVPDLLFTSPPYADARDYGGADQDPERLAAFLRHAPAGLRCVNLGIIRRDGEVQTYWDAYLRAARSAGLKLLSWNVWRQTGGFSVGEITAMFPIEHEFIFVFGQAPRELNRTVPNATAGQTWTAPTRQRDGTKKPNSGAVIQAARPIGTVFESGPAAGARGGGDHPAQFPAALPGAYIEACTQPGGLVLDPFLGSGTTLAAAEQLGRSCWGVELEPRYVDAALHRWASLTGREPVREDGATLAQAREAAA